MTSQSFEVTLQYKGEKAHKFGLMDSATAIGVLVRDLAVLKAPMPGRSSNRTKRTGRGETFHMVWECQNLTPKNPLIINWRRLAGDNYQSLKIKNLKDGLSIGSIEVGTNYFSSKVEFDPTRAAASPKPIPTQSRAQSAHDDIVIAGSPVLPRKSRFSDLPCSSTLSEFMLPIPVSAPSPDLTSSKCPQGQLPSASQDLVSKKRPGSPLMKSSTGSIRKLDNSTDFQEDNEDVQMKGVPQTTPPSIENQDGCRSNNTSAISMAAVKREPSPESQPIRENQSDGQSAREPHKQDVILERKPPQLPSPRISSIHTQYSTSSAHVERLTRELLTAQREIAAFQAREQTILSQLGASGIVSKAAVTERDTLAVSELKALLRMSEDDVIYERERRLRAEQRLRDVERECKHPFVVPALMQALFNISELTDAVD